MVRNVDIDWIAVDWGTSHLRAWAMSRGGEVLAHASSDDGMAKLEPEAFEPALVRLIDGWLGMGRRMPIVACGMVGARQGWCEAAYGTVPCRPLDAGKCARPIARDDRLDVAIIPGLCQLDPADVMRGEETQIAGVLAQNPGFDGRLCLPGTHTKWVSVNSGRIEGFRTVMTGEVFSLLSEQSVLRHSIGDGWDDAAFISGFERGRVQPASALGDLFSLRATSLVATLDPAAARATLSGLLIGAEFAALDIGPEPVAMVGTSGMATAYRMALAHVGTQVTSFDSESVTLAGLCAAHNHLAGATP